MYLLNVNLGAHLFFCALLSACSVLSGDEFFVGDFQNLGYWKDVQTSSPITLDQRLQSSQNLYRLVGEKMGLGAGDYVLEVGCGKGVGAALLVQECSPGRFHAIDTDPGKITRAQLGTSSNASLTFLLGSVEALPSPDNFYHKILSVELAQEMPQLTSLAREACRVLKSGGHLIIAAYFSKEGKPMEGLLPIDQVQRQLAEGGLTDVHVESIGEHVWPEVDRWAEQVEPSHTVRKLAHAYREGRVDYYLIKAVKPCFLNP